ncbi:MAG: PepSY-like domain-containing protein [Bacteroidota bacterium]|nr:PepSY-like domain-containing protein [Bacteroidota bacterium]
MKNSSKYFLLAIVILFSCSSVMLNAQETKKGKKKNIPQVVLDSFNKSYPKAIIRGTDIEKEDGKTFYEIESLDGKVKRDLLFLPDGKIAEIEETISPNDLPAVIKNSITSAMPKAKILKAEMITKNDVISYELIVKDGKFKKEIALDKAGKITNTELLNGKEKKDNEKEEKENK